MSNSVAARDAMGIARNTSGTFTGAGEAHIVTLGFRPKHVTLINTTDATKIEKIDGMGTTQSLQTVTAGAQTVQTSSQIVIDNNGFTVSAAAAANGKAIVWAAY